MTTEHPTAPRLLRRRSDDRVIGGVASGLGDFLNVDPLLIRIGFVGLMVFGGLGLLLYVGGWLLVPEDSSDESILEELLHRTGLTPTRWLVVLLFALGLFIFMGGVVNAYAFSELALGFGVALMVVVLGGALLFRGAPSATAAAPSAPSAQASEPRARATARPVAAPRPRRRTRPRSPLGWYVLGALLVAIGLLALATNLTSADVELGQFFGMALAVIGAGLVVGTWWGHARLLILLGVLLLPLAIAASFVTAPIEGGIGLHRFSPANADELQAEYRLLGGRMELDLTEITAGDAPVELAASVAGGQLYLVLPADASVEVDAKVGAGQLGVLGSWQGGTGLADRSVRDGEGPHFILDVEMGIGSLWVDGVQTEGR